MGALALLGACATVPPKVADIDLIALRGTDDHVATIAYRLAVAGEPICPRKARLTGLTLQDADQYAPRLRAAARSVLGAGERVSVLAVAPDSPAARAGILPGDVVVSIGGVRLVPSTPSANASFAGVAAALAKLDVAATARVFTLEVERGGIGLVVPVAPVTGCASQVQVRLSPEAYARADGRVLSVSTALLDYVRSDDELALAIAHEMAHNALGHRVSLEAEGVRLGTRLSAEQSARVLAVERVADRFGYYLMARAGFDPGVAAAFWQRLHEGPAGGRADPRTHPAAAIRIATARAIASQIADRKARGLPLTP